MQKNFLLIPKINDFLFANTTLTNYQTMKKIIYTLLICLVYACSTGKAALQQGNYEEAVIKAVNRLRSSPDNDNARQTLLQAYPLALNWNKANIDRMKYSNEKFKWESIAQSYDNLNRLYDEIMRCPACLQLIPQPSSYLNEGNEARNAAAAERYETADRLLQDNPRNRLAAKEALRHFATAENLLPNYRDTRKKMEEARFLATLKIVVEQVPVASRFYQLSDEFFRNKIYQYINTNPRMNEFVRFYTPQEAQIQGLTQPDQVVRLQFDDFVVGETLMTANTETITSKDSVKVGEVKVEGKKIDVFNKVTAKLTINRKTVSSKGLLDMKIIDPYTNTVIHQDKMMGEFVWFSEWGNFNGDERALTTQQKQICNRREVPPPPPQDLFIEFCKPLHDQATNKIRNFYRNY
jgi:hypothetical protein